MGLLRKSIIPLSILIVAVSLLSLMPGRPFTTVSEAARVQMNYFSELKTLSDVLKLVQAKYVEEEVAKDKEALIQGGIEGILKKLDDPFTRFMPPSTFKSMQEETEGEFGGLGIILGMRDKILTIISPVEGTPAFRVGVRAADKIVKINGQSTKGMSVEEAVKLLRGKPKTSVTISVAREGVKEFIDYEIVRDIIKIPSVKAGMVEEGIGYARLTGFVQTSGKDLLKEINKLQEKGPLKGFILDLRGNPGGLLTAAVEVSQMFLQRGQTIVSIKEREGEPTVFPSKGNSNLDFPMIVMIDGGSASASEIVAGAIKDNKRGLLLGRKTFGKGSVQTVLPLQDGSALALTTAYYYTPADIKIHKKGIEPDLDVEFPKLTNEELKEYRDEMETIANANYEKTRDKQDKWLKDHGKEDEVESAQSSAATTGTTDAAKIEELKNSKFLPIPKFDAQWQRAVEVLKASTLLHQLGKAK